MQCVRVNKILSKKLKMLINLVLSSPYTSTLKMTKLYLLQTFLSTTIANKVTGKIKRWKYPWNSDRCNLVETANKYFWNSFLTLEVLYYFFSLFLGNSKCFPCINIVVITVVVIDFVVIVLIIIVLLYIVWYTSIFTYISSYKRKL